MTSRLKKLGQRLLEKRFFRVAWFAKDSQQHSPEEALEDIPEALTETLIDSVNDLPMHPHRQKAVIEAIESAISRWRSHPQSAANSIVIISDPVSSISRILIDSLQKLKSVGEDQDAKDSGYNAEDSGHSCEKDCGEGGSAEQANLKISLLNWVERPANVSTIKRRIVDELDLAEESVEGELQQPSFSSQDPSNSHTLVMVPNLCWCFLRSADGLDGLDYLQDFLPCDHTRFWILGSGVVGWEYLESTIKFHAYCGKVITLPKLSGEELQSWLKPIIEEFDIYFPDNGLHKRLQDGDHLLDIDVDIDKPIETVSEITQEITASVQSSLRSLKNVFRSDKSPEEINSPRESYFERLAAISEGVDEVAVQVFIKSLRYHQVELTEEGSITEKSKSELASENASDSIESGESKDGQEESEENSKGDSQKECRLIATTPRLPPLPELTQGDLYLLYSLMLHGDLTLIALAQSLGDSPNATNNQVQILRNAGIVEQQADILKINPVHYPRLRRELSRNNFIIKVP